MIIAVDPTLFFLAGLIFARCLPSGWSGVGGGERGYNSSNSLTLLRSVSFVVVVVFLPPTERDYY